MKSSRSLTCIIIGAFSLLMPLFAARAQTQDVDVMILYDRSAQTWLSTSHGGSYLANANLAIAKLNQAMTNSGVTVNYRLCHFGVMDTNLVMAGLNLTNVMAYVKEPTNQIATNTLYPWREAMGADLVTIMVNGMAPGFEEGVADAPPNAAGDSNMAFSISIIPFTELDDSLTHGIGHNMGCGHSKYERSSDQTGPGPEPGPGVFPYAAGWYFTGTDGVPYRTVMATFDNGNGWKFNLTVPSIFSTPNLRYMGIPVGDAVDGDNVSCLTNMIPVIGNYYAAPADTPPSVEITSPYFGDSIPEAGGHTYPVFAEAMAPSGSIASVDFYKDGILIGTSTVPTTNSPNLYSYDVPKFGGGSNSLWCVAWDTGGVAWTSAVTRVIEIGTGPRPKVELIYNPPVHSSLFTTTNGIRGWYQDSWLIKDITANATDADGWVDHVEFYRISSDGATTNYIGPVSTIPYTISWRCPSIPVSGSVTNYIVAYAVDNDGWYSDVSVTNMVVTGPNMPPYVEILSPANGATQSQYHITIAPDAHAYDNDGTITQMVFYVDGVPTITLSGYTNQFAWLPLSLGTFTLTIAVWDNDGVCATSPPSMLTVNGDQPPTIAITYPANSAVLSGNWVTIVATNASDPDDYVANVQFLVDGSPVATVTNPPYCTTALGLTPGGHTLSAVAVDQLGLTATSSVVVTSGVNPPPVVTITSPTNNEVVSANSANVTLQCTAVASVGQITSVVFYVDGTFVGVSTSAPYSVSMANPGVGSHVTTVAAWDDSGNGMLAQDTWFVLPSWGAGATIDVMILYDRSAQTWLKDTHGGSYLANANLAIAKLNQAMANSGVSVNYRLCHFGVMDTNLPALGLKLTNVMSYVKAPTNQIAANTLYPWRKAMGADLVTVMVDGITPGFEEGVADVPPNIGGDSNMAFSISLIPFTEIDDSLTHSIGHNMGCGHSRFDRPSDEYGPGPEPGPGVFPYAAGWYFTGTDGVPYRTVMATFDNGNGWQFNLTAPSIFSTPSKRYMGIPVGTNDADNASCLTNMIPVIGGYFTPPADTPPSVEITSPYCQQFIPVSVGHSYPVFAETMAPSGSIASVDFYKDGILIGTTNGPTTNSPNLYSYNMPMYGGGTNSLSCVAWDTGGVAWTSAVTVVFEDGADRHPRAELLYNPPVHSSQFTTTNGIQGWRQSSWLIRDITANATDSDGWIDHVEFYRISKDGTTSNSIGQVSNTPYTVSWRCPSVPLYGSVTNYIIAIAVDNDNLHSPPSSTNIVVTGPNMPPYVEITSPTNGAAQSQHNISIVPDAHAYDNDGTITQMIFYVDGVSTLTFSEQTNAFTWLPLSLGIHTLTIAVWDNDSACATSSPVTVSISGDLPPTIAITYPTNSAALSGSWVTIMADASDPDDSVANVQFLVDGSLVATVTNPPYWVTTLGLTPGGHTLSAVAVDQLGLTATSSVAVTSGATLPPVVTITSPTNNEVVSAKSVRVTNQCTVVYAGQITSVVFYVDGTFMGANTSAPYSVSMANPGIGAHATTVAVWDNSGNCLLAGDTWSVVRLPEPAITNYVDVMVLFDGTARTWLATRGNDGAWLTNPDVLKTPELSASTTNSMSFLAFANLKIAELNLALLNSGVTNLHYNLNHFGVINSYPYRTYPWPNVPGGALDDGLPFFPDDPASPASRSLSLTNYLCSWKTPGSSLPDDPVTIDAKYVTQDRINQWRAACGADLVAVLMDGTDKDGPSGISDLLKRPAGDDSKMCSISFMPFAELDATFSHSIGQNMGCGTSKFSGQPTTNLWPGAIGWMGGPGVFSNSAGWYFKGEDGTNYCTICASTNDYAGYGYRLTDPQMFSTPNKRYRGIPIGETNDGDNVSSLIKIAPVIANYYTNSWGSVPPSVEIVSPGYGERLSDIGITFTVKAEVMDPNQPGGITGVEFHNLGANPFYPPSDLPPWPVETNSVPGNPNLFVCTNLVAASTGTNWLYCVAWNNSGLCWTSAVTYAYLEQGYAPSIKMVSQAPSNSWPVIPAPSDGGPGWVQHGWYTTNIAATATPKSQSWIITDVYFYTNKADGTPDMSNPIDHVVNSSMTTGAFTAMTQWRCTNPPPAPQTVTNFFTASAVAFHDPFSLSSAASDCNTNVIIMVQNIPPFAEIISPTNNTMQWRTNIEIFTTGHAYDIDGTITQMVYTIATNGVTVTNLIYTQQQDHCTYYAPTNQGTFSLSVEVWDDDGATNLSPWVDVTIGANQPPSVTITSPADGAHLPGTGINIDALAVDPDGFLDHVDFLIDGGIVATIRHNRIAGTDYPYSMDTWVTNSGAHTLQAVAVDDLGAAATSAVVNVICGVNVPPTVTITTPTNGALFSTEYTVTNVLVTATATAAQGVITSVVFYLDGVLQTNLTSAPYNYSITPRPMLGTHTTTVAAWDDSGDCRRVSTTWTVMDMPDLVITRLRANPVVPMTGTVFQVIVDIANAGVAAASNFHVSVWADHPAVALNDAGEDAGVDVAFLDTNQVMTIIFNNLDAGTSSVYRTLRAFVDSRLTVYEEEEGNNQAVRNYRPSGEAVFDRIDVMLLYDRTAQTWLNQNDGGSFLANANLVMGKLNQAMSNSAVSVNYRLVHFGIFDTNYLGSLTNTAYDMVIGPQSDTIDAARTSCGADLVVQMVNGPLDNGFDVTGFYPDSPFGNPYAAFSVSIIPNTELGDTMTRGIAYNMGCGNSKKQLSYPGPGVFPYAAGWYFQAQGVNYCTLMGAQDDGYGIHYELTQPAMFSSPDVRYIGVPAGDVDNGDNARCIRNMLPVVESYRLEPVNIPPSVELVSPSVGTNFPSPRNCSNIAVCAEALDVDGTITSVVFYAATPKTTNIVYAAVTTSSLPGMSNIFSNDIPSTNSGTLYLTAVAWDNSGSSWTSAVTTVSVASNLPPTVTLDSPLNNTYQHGMLVTNIAVTASDPDGAIAYVEFYADDINLIGTVTNTLGADNTSYVIDSWICPWTFPDNTNIDITFTAVAYDDEGARTKSGGSKITLGPDLPPFIEILSPTNGTVTWKTDITITAAPNAYDIDDVITQVVFYVDGVSNGGTFAGAPCTTLWMAPGQGTYTLTVVAWASDNQCSTSQPVVLNITTNSPPVITISSDTNTANRRISIIANATDPNDDISNVVFFVNGNAVGTNAYHPYARTWLSPSSGVYNVSAVVTDQGELAATSTPIAVRSGTALTPALSITAPQNNFVFSNTTATLKFQTAITDQTAVVTSLLFYVNGVLTDSRTTPAGIKAGAWQLPNPGIGDYETTFEALLSSGDPQFATVKWLVRDMRPDFQVVSIILNPSTPSVGQTFSAIVTVTNAGWTAANIGTVSIWTNHPGPVSWGNLDGANGTNSTVGILAAQTSKAVTFAGINAGLVESTGRTFRALVDSQHLTPESNENNNQMATNYNVRIMADLVVSSITLDPIVPSTGYVFNAAVVLKNQGHGVASNFHVSVWANMAAVPVDSTGESQGTNITSLDVGQVVTNMFLGLDAGTGKVARTLRVFVDSTNGVVEESKTNNQLTKAYTPTGHAEFWVTAISLTPTNPVAGKTFTATVTVTNSGSISGKAGSLYVWADKPGVVALKTPADKSVSVGTLNMNQGKILTITGLTAGTGGTKTFRAFIDATGVTTEMIETNNQTTLSYNVITMADLTISGVILTPSVPARGGVFTAAVTVTNIGSATATGVYVSVWADMPAVPTNNAGADDESMVGNIGPSQSYLYTTVLDAGTGTVARTFRAFADSTLVVPESSETNNQKTVVYKPASRPDFIITGITLSSTNPPVGSTNLSAQVTAKNIGYASGNGGYVDVWADRATSVVPNATNRGDKYASVGTLATNASKTMLFSGMSVGTNTVQRTFRALVNSRAATLEITQTNNEGTATYTPQ